MITARLECFTAVFFSYADPSEKFRSLKSKPSIVKTFQILTIIKLCSKLIFFKILLYELYQNKSYIDLKTEIFHLGRHRKKNTAVCSFFYSKLIGLPFQKLNRLQKSIKMKSTKKLIIAGRQFQQNYIWKPKLILIYDHENFNFNYMTEMREKPFNLQINRKMETFGNKTRW